MQQLRLAIHSRKICAVLPTCLCLVGSGGTHKANKANSMCDLLDTATSRERLLFSLRAKLHAMPVHFLITASKHCFRGCGDQWTNLRRRSKARRGLLMLLHASRSCSSSNWHYHAKAASWAFAGGITVFRVVQANIADKGISQLLYVLHVVVYDSNRKMHTHRDRLR